MLPQSIEQRNKLNKYVEQSVNLMIEIDTLKDDISNVVNIVVGEFGMKKGDFNSIVKARYDSDKLQTTIEDLQTSLSNSDILKGE